MQKGKKEYGALNLVGPRIRETRRERNISQQELSKFAKDKNIALSGVAICKIERQERSCYDYELKFFAETLDVSVNAFYADAP